MLFSESLISQKCCNSRTKSKKVSQTFSFHQNSSFGKKFCFSDEKGVYFSSFQRKDLKLKDFNDNDMTHTYDWDNRGKSGIWGHQGFRSSLTRLLTVCYEHLLSLCIPFLSYSDSKLETSFKTLKSGLNELLC